MILNSNRIVIFFTCILSFFNVITRAAPPKTGASKLSYKSLNLQKIYPPDPPVTHHVVVGISYFNGETSKRETQEITVDLFGTVVPKSAMNFQRLSQGIRVVLGFYDPDKTLLAKYKGSKINKIANGFIEGGEVLPGISSFSAHGLHFEDENFDLTHDRPGRLSWVNDEKKDNNDSRFAICLKKEGCSERDGTHVVFGQVVAGLDGLIDKLQNVETDENGAPKEDVTILYSVVDELKLANKDVLQKEYLKKLEAFKDGEVSQGITLAETLGVYHDDQEVIADLRFEQLHHPLFKVLLGMCALLACYFLVKKRKVSKVVSLRRDE
ncbi:peptidylprolyl isomerase family protein CPR8 NDAI_0K01560 [Naumovozyma dairenensis CBS 421]|uniref:PPIase cyclophilin-type domain-containing protein n=1 Tax=Naumovozyma dairenensis (strain ATCC 10597 / BCRC 20456 / CBS 421 / NBRC 0211 / NRRL Y-12639) TaxID=1071378 RepID=G0WHT6_NAUDC|nr:hypothetical protein NDAI_0K01560 [Naumovozyma dairenensis CBS 421]CCD27347.1 hypothetical protein NDAI_0K01560 [Naumovozyma dairenensis CBS 421]